MTKKILVICRANISRSPLLAATIAAATYGTDIQVSSAGLEEPTIATYRTANVEFLQMVRQLRDSGGIKGFDRGFFDRMVGSLERHHSRVVTPEMINEANVVLTMEPEMVAALRHRFSAHCANLNAKVFTAPAFLTEQVGKIPERQMRVLDPVVHEKQGERTVGKTMPIGVQRMKILGQILRLGNGIGAKLQSRQIEPVARRGPPQPALRPHGRRQRKR